MGLSVGLHTLVAAALLIMLTRSVPLEEPEPVRLVFVGPAPGTGPGVPAALPEEGPAVPDRAADAPAAEERLVAPPEKGPPAPAPAKPKAEQRRTEPPRRRPPAAASAAPRQRAAPEASPRGGASDLAGRTQPFGHAGDVPGGRGDDAYPAGAIPSPPVLIGREVPNYPVEARRREVQGVVLLEAIVDREGRVEPNSVKVLESVALLDGAAVEAVKRWRFRPGRDRNGATVRVILEIPIRFALR